MTLFEWLKAKKAIILMAILEGKSIAEVRNSIQDCIDTVWDIAWTPGNLNAQVKWQQMFPNGKKPTIEQFIVGIARQVKTIEDSSPQLKLLDK